MIISDLENRLGVSFRRIELLKEALTHRSYLNENPSWPLPHNERLEYLGDAVLELTVTENLFQKFTDRDEGWLTSVRAALVNYLMLGKVAREIGLETYLYLSRGELKDTGKARDVILANAIEALFGAIYLDQGYEAAQKVIVATVLTHLDEVLEQGLYRDPKSKLQEIIQESLKVTPTYRVLSESGPDHQKLFSVGAFFGDRLVAKGLGTSKQEGELKAAEAALAEIEKSL